MSHFIQFNDLPPALPRPKIAAAIGVFDGVHRGHQAVIQAACALAAQSGALPAAITFDPSPKALFSPAAFPPPLTTLDERFALLKSAGAQVTGRILFSREVASWDPFTFLQELCHADDFELTGICVGSRWRFAAGASGNTAFLQEYCREHGILFSAVPELTMDGRVISSSLIRRLIAEGELEAAADRLGRLCRLSGRVVRGMGIAGDSLHTPTANLDTAALALPPDGVYAGQTETDGKWCPVILNLGQSPTFGVTSRRLEVHLLGFSGDLYGKTLTVELLAKLRGIRRFSGADALTRQIIDDIARTEKIFKEYHQRNRE